MADIYAFPAGAPRRGRPTQADDLPSRPAGVPDEVWEAVESVRAMEHVAEVRYREIPVPSTLADYGIGIELECGPRGGDNDFSSDLSEAPQVATGWIMILHSNTTRDDWGGRWRCVAFARMPLQACENDGLTPGMYWEDLCDHLVNVEPDSLGGTVTVTQNTAFGSLPGGTNAGCEMRVSFTPLDDPATPGVPDAGGLVSTWAAFVKSTVQFGEDAAIA